MITELIKEKTGGNPFFIKQLIKSLYKEGDIFFNEQSGSWHWNIESIRNKDVTNNVIDLMIGKILKLPEKTQHILRISSCMGNFFDLNTLLVVSKIEKNKMMAILLDLVKEGLILPVHNISVEIQEFGKHGHDLNNRELFTENIDPRLEIAANPIISRQTKKIVKYKFIHDRVQQAAYSLIPKKEKKRIHQMIGKFVLENTNQNEKKEMIFDIVNHLNK
jgi:predicted ATPase